MSAPEDRLVGDAAAERFELEARAALACGPLVSPALTSLAAATLALVEDRQARVEIAAARNGKSE